MTASKRFDCQLTVAARRFSPAVLVGSYPTNAIETVLIAFAGQGQGRLTLLFEGDHPGLAA